MSHAARRLNEIRATVRAPLIRLLATEHDEQVAVIDWWGYECKRHNLPVFALFAIPNAGAGAQKGRAGWLKAEGVRKGIPDLCLAVARGGFHGLYIELKRVEGHGATPEQQEVLAYLDGAGYKALCVRGANAAIAAIREYLAS